MAAVVAHTIAAIPSGATPTAAQTTAFVASIYAAARSLTSQRGGGLLGHVGAVMPAAQYQAMANRCLQPCTRQWPTLFLGLTQFPPSSLW